MINRICGSIACIVCLCVPFVFSEPAPLFDVAVGSSLQKIMQDGSNIQTLQFVPRAYVDMAADEAESFQLVIIPNGKPLEKVNVKIEPANEQQLAITWHIVGYVKTGNPSYGTEHVGWWPDPLMPASEFNVPVEQVQPLWFTVTAPADTKSKMYQSRISVTAGGFTSQIILNVRVRNFALARPGSFAAPFGVYMNNVANWYYGKNGQLKIDEFANWCRFLMDYRLTPKNIGDEYVKVTKKMLPDGSEEIVAVDMNDLCKTVGVLAGRLSPYAYGLYRLPSAPVIERAMKERNQKITPESVATPVKKYYDKWKRQGFPDKVYVYGIDEPVGDAQFEFTRKAYAIIKKEVPSCKIMQTGNCAEPRLVGLVDIWCPKTNIVDNQFFAQRRAAGDTVWTYICCSPVAPYANFFVDEPAIDHRILFWQTKKVGASGFLLWATTWWKGLEPTAFSGKTCFPDIPIDLSQSQEYRRQWVHTTGDGLLIYPGKNVTPLPSIRLEIVRDGIEDFEYLTTLEELTAEVKKIKLYQGPEGREVIAQAQSLCLVPDAISKSMTEYTKDPRILLDRRKAVADMIEQLSNILVEKDYDKLWQNSDYWKAIVD